MTHQDPPKSSLETPSPKVEPDPPRQNELSVVLGEIEEYGKWCRKGHFTPMQNHIPVLVKALRELWADYQILVWAQSHTARVAEARVTVKERKLAAILTQAKGELEKKEDLGERGAT